MADGWAKWADGVSYDAANVRRAEAVHQMPDGLTAFGGRSGRRLGPGLEVTILSSPDRATVAPGAGTAYDATNASEGCWEYEIPTAITKTFTARPGAGTSRIDVLAVTITPGPTGTPGPNVTLTAGAAATSPAAPAAPARSHVLGTFLVPASGVITFTANTARTVAAGGVLPVATTAERDALAPYAGLMIWNAQTATPQINDGTTWRDLAGVASVGDLPKTAADTATTSGGSTAWAADGSSLSLSFVAPASGRVRVSYAAYLVNTGTGAVNVYAGLAWSGGMTRAPLDNVETLVVRSASNGIRGSANYLVTGLTPGTTYTLTPQRKVDSGGVAYIAGRYVLVEAA